MCEECWFRQGHWRDSSGFKQAFDERWGARAEQRGWLLPGGSPCPTEAGSLCVCLTLFFSLLYLHLFLSLSPPAFLLPSPCLFISLSLSSLPIGLSVCLFLPFSLSGHHCSFSIQGVGGHAWEWEAARGWGQRNVEILAPGSATSERPQHHRGPRWTCQEPPNVHRPYPGAAREEALGVLHGLGDHTRGPAEPCSCGHGQQL